MNTGAGNESSLFSGLADLQNSGSIADFLAVAFDAIVILNLQEQITYWNLAAEQMFGWKVLEALGKMPAEIFWPLRTSREKKTHQQRLLSLNRGAVLRGEFPACRKDGSALWVQYTARAIFDPESKVACYLTLYRDISVHMRLRESEERFRTMANDLPFLIWVTNARGGIEMVNRTYEKFFGVKEEQVMAPHRWQPLLHPDEQEAYTSAFFKSVEEQTPFSAEVRVKRADGEWRWIASQATPRFSVNGEFLGHVGSSPDITERRRAEEELRELSQRLTYHVDNSPLAVIEWGPDMRLIRWSGAAEQMFGWKAEEVLGKRIEDLRWVYDDDTQQVNNVSIVLQTGEDPRRFSANRNYRKDGTIAYCEWYNSALVDEVGNLHSILSLVSDVTERKRAEEALRRNEKQLQLLNETLEQKVHAKTAQVRRLASDLVKAEQRERSRISHILHDDLQQRIYALQMDLAFLSNELQQENEVARQEVSNIETQMGEIRQVIRHLSIELSPPILPEEGLSHALNWLATQMQQQHGLPMEVEAEGSFAISDEKIHVLLFNCVRELLFNIVKHAQASRAVVALQWCDDGLRIEVRDDGKGFTLYKENGELGEKDELPPTFGLPTIRHQLNLFGGNMEIDSEPGAGTRVVLMVPVTQAGQESVVADREG